MEQNIFTNYQVDLKDLPTAAGIQFNGLEKKYRRIQYIVSLIVSTILLIGLVVLYFVSDPPGWVGASAFGLWLLLLILQFVFIKNGFIHKGYVVRTRDLVYKKGWLYKKQVTVPFSRIQHVDIKQGVLERSYGLSKLNLYTAGGASSDLSIPGLKLEDAKRIKSFILGIMTSDEEE